MVLQLQLWFRTRLENLIQLLVWFLFWVFVWISVPTTVSAETELTGAQYLNEAAQLYRAKDYFKAARYAFAANKQDPRLKPDAYAWMTLGLIHAGMPNAASYFFIRTLQSGKPEAIRSVLGQTQLLLVAVGPDLLRKYLIRHTRYDDYDTVNRSAYLYALGKDAILSGDQNRAIGYFNGVNTDSPLWPYTLQLRGAAYAILGRHSDAIADFERCASQADRIIDSQARRVFRVYPSDREVDDLRSRCLAGVARVYYQMDDLEVADRKYDRVQKKSFVWPDMLFEQAWNSFGRREYNRTLGKLVSYKSPALKFMFNTEVEVLRAQAFLALCLYSDANDAINEFNSNYTELGVQVKDFVEENENRLSVFYEEGKKALRSSLYTGNKFHQLMNRFVRSPYFQTLVANERQIAVETALMRRWDQSEAGVSHRLDEGFPGFLSLVLQWRLKSIQLLGGAFVKNSLIDYHAALLEDFEKMAFIKLEMLKKAKDKLLYKQVASVDRSRGNLIPSRRDDQYRWSFNGEFWNDELGDYVFALESECKE